MHDASLISCTRPYRAPFISVYFFSSLSVLEKNKETVAAMCYTHLQYVLKYKIHSVWCNFMSFLKPSCVLSKIDDGKLLV